jgi:hypothetical protein
MEKRCKKCGVVKPLDEFYRATGGRDGHRTECKECNAAASKARYVADPAAAVARVKRWQQANPERLNAYRRERRADPEVKRNERSTYLKRTYGLTLAEYEEMLAQQEGGCAICGRKPSASIALHVDHDHATGQIRGLLCFRCNNSLGDLDDDPELLWAALKYVGWHPAPDAATVARLAELKAMRPAWAAG